MSRGFQDHFSGHADAYARYRPAYPDALFEWLADQAPGHRCAWDCATGNGQAARALARYFDNVIATDASAEQVANATPADRVRFAVAPAENSGLEEGSVHLVTVAQALHWFDLPAFWAEVRRVLEPGGVVAAWCYQLARITPAVDAVVDHLYRDIVGPYWPLGRRQVELGYGDIVMPFEEIETPSFEMSAEWTLEHLSGYLGTWSAVQRYIAEHGEDPVQAVLPGLQAAWGEPGNARRVAWPLDLRAARA